MPAISLDVADAIELAELLQLIDDWLQSDPGNLTSSLARFTGSPVTALRNSAATSPGSGSSLASPTARVSSARANSNQTPSPGPASSSAPGSAPATRSLSCGTPVTAGRGDRRPSPGWSAAAIR
jgi:hypothetical protein